jgi:5'-nucleotidase
MGGRCSDVSEPHDIASCEKQHEVMTYLEKLPEGTIDAFFAGHTHAQMRHYVKGVPVVQGLAFSREFSTVDLWIDVKNDRVEKSELRPPTMICSFVYEGTEHCDPKQAPGGAKLVPRVFGGRTIESDPRVATVIDPFMDRVAAKRGEKLGIRTSAPFTRAYLTESPLGDLLADALRDATGADVAIMNSGGIRAELPAGDLTYADLFAVSPFDNYPAVMNLTGRQIADILRLTTGGARGIMQVSGLRYTYDAAKDADKPAAERDRLVSVTLENGAPLQPDRVYSVAMPDFIAAGGDGVQDITSQVPPERVQVFYARPIRDIVIDAIRKRPMPLAPAMEGRVTVLNPAK